MSEIIVAERLKELFATLPPVQQGVTPNVTEFPIRYDFGTYQHLLRYLADCIDQEKDPYPLVWFDTRDNKATGFHKITTKIKLVVAIDTVMTISNSERIETTFKGALNPVVKNIYKALRTSNISSILDENKIERFDHFNYTGIKTRSGEKKKTQQKTIAIWDAVELHMSITLNNSPLKTCIYYG